MDYSTKGQEEQRSLECFLKTYYLIEHLVTIKSKILQLPASCVLLQYESKTFQTKCQRLWTIMELMVGSNPTFTILISLLHYTTYYYNSDQPTHLIEMSGGATIDFSEQSCQSILFFICL